MRIGSGERNGPMRWMMVQVMSLVLLECLFKLCMMDTERLLPKALVS